MIDAKTGHALIGHQVENHPMAVFKDRLQLDAKTDQAVDREEAPVVELFLGGAPEGEPVVLLLQQRIQRIQVLADGIDLESDKTLARDGEFRIVIPHDHLSAPTVEGQPSSLQFASIPVTEDPQQHLALHG